MPEVLSRTNPVTLDLISRPHWPLYHALYSSNEVMASIGPVPSEHVIGAQFERVLRHNAVDSPGHRAWSIAVDGAALGLAALLRDGNRAEFGVMLLPTAWRRRIAAEVTRAVARRAFALMNLDQIAASRCDDGHAVVIDRLLMPVGFERGPGLRPREVGWYLPKTRWLVRDNVGRLEASDRDASLGGR